MPDRGESEAGGGRVPSARFMPGGQAQQHPPSKNPSHTIVARIDSERLWLLEGERLLSAPATHWLVRADQPSDAGSRRLADREYVASSDNAADRRSNRFNDGAWSSQQVAFELHCIDPIAGAGANCIVRQLIAIIVHVPCDVSRWRRDKALHERAMSACLCPSTHNYFPAGAFRLTSTVPQTVVTTTRTLFVSWPRASTTFAVPAEQQPISVAVAVTSAPIAARLSQGAFTRPPDSRGTAGSRSQWRRSRS